MKGQGMHGWTRKRRETRRRLSYAAASAALQLLAPQLPQRSGTLVKKFCTPACNQVWVVCCAAHRVTEAGTATGPTDKSAPSMHRSNFCARATSNAVGATGGQTSTSQAASTACSSRGHALMADVDGRNT